MSQPISKHEITFDENDLPYSQRFGDHYFSRNDGRAECAYVFLQGNNLPDRWRDMPSDVEFVIGELGFGTGLNFLETWSQWRQFRTPGQKLIFASVEGFPVTKAVARRALAAWPELEEDAEKLLTNWQALGGPINMDDQTVLHVHIGQAVEQVAQFPKTDAWFLDGFSPAKNPDMWSLDLMNVMAQRTNTAGTFASYTAAGWVRKNLSDAGFSVSKLPGFGTKRDMIAGSKL